ncbi:MAG: hypothetical protein HZA10_01470 [Nitrospirae bacterium]|nr:hypothetical protein [Nitrospirota bacterium]
MTPEVRAEVLRLMEKTINYSYPLRWADKKTTMADFDGRESTIDVFSIPALEQINFLTKMSPIRKQIKEMTGHRCIFIFHSPEATAAHYSHLFPITHRVHIMKGEIQFSLPAPGSTEGKPIITSPPQYNIYDIKVAA